MGRGVDMLILLLDLLDFYLGLKGLVLKRANGLSLL